MALALRKNFGGAGSEELLGVDALYWRASRKGKSSGSKQSAISPLSLYAAWPAPVRDGADVLIFGITTMHQSHAQLSVRLNLPVLKPSLICAQTCEMLRNMGLAHSKTKYLPPELRSSDVFYDRIAR